MTRLHHRNLAPEAKEFANVVYFIVWLRFTGWTCKPVVLLLFLSLLSWNLDAKEELDHQIPQTIPHLV
jgi:hypothetical protein